MQWNRFLQAHTISAAVIALFGCLLIVLAYAPGTFWGTIAWAAVGVMAVGVLAVVANLLYAVVALESGSPHSAATAQAHSGSRLKAGSVVSFRSVSGDGVAVPAAVVEPKSQGATQAARQRPPEQTSRPASLPFTTGSLKRSVRLEDAIADLGAAEYLLSKVQNSPAFFELTGAQQRDCEHAVSRIRRLLDEVAKSTFERKSVS